MIGRPGRLASAVSRPERRGREKVMYSSKKGLTKAVASGGSHNESRAEAMTAPRPREQRRPPAPPDRRPPRRGGGSSPSIYAESAAVLPAGPGRLRDARRGLVRSARALAAAALLALFGALALPTATQAQSVTTLVSNIGQGSTTTRDAGVHQAQRFTTGSHRTGYTP